MSVSSPGTSASLLEQARGRSAAAWDRLVALYTPLLEAWLTALPVVGAPDYSDQAMLQYLRTERIIPPYQTRGYKIVELVRIYEAGAPRRE